MAGDRTWFRSIEPRTRARARLLFFPHAGGRDDFFSKWSTLFPKEIELSAASYLAWRASGAASSAESASLTALADAMAAEIARGPRLPLVLFGHSMGAIVAYEVAKRITARGGHRIAQLVVSGSSAPGLYEAARAHEMDDDAFLGELARLGGTDLAAFEDPAFRAAWLPRLREDFRLIEDHVPGEREVLDCPVLALNGDVDTEIQEEHVKTWALHTRAPFVSKVFEGNHFYLVPQWYRVAQAVLRTLEGTGCVRASAMP